MRKHQLVQLLRGSYLRQWPHVIDDRNSSGWQLGGHIEVGEGQAGGEGRDSPGQYSVFHSSPAQVSLAVGCASKQPLRLLQTGGVELLVLTGVLLQATRPAWSALAGARAE